MPAAADLPTQRLFIGLFPDAAVRAAIDAQRAQWRWPPGVRLTESSRLHMTLHFLGEVPIASQVPLRESLGEVAVTPFDLSLGPGETWRNRIAVLRSDAPEALIDLHARIGARLALLRLAAAGMPWSRPHITIARRCAGAVPPGQAQPIPWRVTEFLLVRSRTAPPIRYEVLSCHAAQC